MRLREIITLREMTYGQAAAILRQHGLDPTLHPNELKPAFRKAAMDLHPDRGGDLEAMQALNAAYDIVAKGAATSRSSASPSRSQSSATPVWAMAGYSGGYPPNANISRNDYTDMNFIKKRMWELSGKSRDEYTLMGFDGHFFRHTLTVYGSPTIFKKMAEALYTWQTIGGNSYACRAVFVFERGGGDDKIHLLYADGKGYWDNPIPFVHHSFNLNPSNDQQFVRKLPQMLDALRDHGPEALKDWF